MSNFDTVKQLGPMIEALRAGMALADAISVETRIVFSDETWSIKMLSDGATWCRYEEQSLSDKMGDET